MNEYVKMYESTENLHICCRNVKCCQTMDPQLSSIIYLLTVTLTV